MQKNKVKIIDEYDGLVSDLQPFWEMSGAEFRLKAFQVCASYHYGWYQSSNAFFFFDARRPKTFPPSIWYEYETVRRRQ